MNTKIYYLHVPAGFTRRGTLAGVFKDGMLHIGVSLCSKKDQFCKALGRTIAAGRATTKASHVFVANVNEVGPNMNREIGEFVNHKLHEVMDQELVKNKIYSVGLASLKPNEKEKI